MVDYGLCVLAQETTPMVPGIRCEVSAFRCREAGSSKPDIQNPKSFSLFAHLVPGSMPLFVIGNDTTGAKLSQPIPISSFSRKRSIWGFGKGIRIMITTVQAIGYSRDKNNGRWKRLLGYVHVEKPADGSYTRLSDAVGDALFPDPTTYHLNLWVGR